MTSRSKPLGHASVLGSGMAGLLAARVLSDFFESVTLFEKDPEPLSIHCRPGIPQGHHVHTLIPGGLAIISRLLPDVPGDLIRGGSLTPAPHEFYFFRPEGKSYAMNHYLPSPPADTGERTVYVQSRALLEHCVRKSVAALENVRIVYNTKVKDVLAEKATITGITFEGGGFAKADLVLDALGRQCKSLRWLEQLGFERPAEEAVYSNFAYTTVSMSPKDPGAFTDVGFLVLPKPRPTHSTRAGGLVRIEGGRWLAFVGGRHGDFPPRDLQGMLDFASTTAEPLLSELIGQAEPVDAPAHYRFNKSTRLRFEKLLRFPEGLLPIGDAICHYNPVYGQGMSVACRHAVALQSCLTEAIACDRGVQGLWRRFLAEAYEETRAPWLLSSLTDLADPRCMGDFPVDEKRNVARLRSIIRHAELGNPVAVATQAALTNLTERLDILDRVNLTQLSSENCVA